MTYALAALAQPLASRQIWRHGGMFVADIFALLLPGIDLNDPAKTGLSGMAISNMVDFIRLSDISEVEGSEVIKPGSRALRSALRPTVEDDPNDPAQDEMEDLSPEEVNERVRFATAAFRDWVPEFLGRVLLLFGNLPEEGGKSGRAGGKTEAMTLQSVLVGLLSDKSAHQLLSIPVVASLPHLMTSYLIMLSTKSANTPQLHVVQMLLMLSAN